VRKGEILGIVGESGSGKSTIARAIAGLSDFRAADARRPVLHGARRARPRLSPRVQIVFQNPDASLNPRQRVRDILSRPLKLYGLAKGRAEIDRRIGELLRRSCCRPNSRAAIRTSSPAARSSAWPSPAPSRPSRAWCSATRSPPRSTSRCRPRSRGCWWISRRTGATCLFITHDLNLVRQLAHTIAVMHRGELVDLFPVGDAARRTATPTPGLLDAVPVPVGGAA
jgi:peptide/nickel transport system ATP-binding protein